MYQSVSDSITFSRLICSFLCPYCTVFMTTVLRPLILSFSGLSWLLWAPCIFV